MTMFHGFHHFYRRQRHSMLSGKRAEQIADRAMYFIGFVGPLMTVPQIVKIVQNHTAEGVSALSWGAYACGSFAWLVYGVIHREKPIILTNAAAGILQLAVVIGVLLYS